MVKPVAAASSWENVNRVKGSFQRDGKTLTKISNFISYVFKLIGAFFVDCYNGFVFVIKSKIESIDKKESDKETKNLKTNRRIKIALGLIFGAVFIGLGYYYLMPRTQPCTIAELKRKVEQNFKYNRLYTQIGERKYVF